MDSKQIKEWANISFSQGNFQEKVFLILADIIDRLESIEYPYGRRKNA